MIHDGIELGADLYKLLRAGTYELPMLAAEYAEVSRFLADADYALREPFRRSEFFGGGPFGPVSANWLTLRDELQQILASTATNLELTGDVLRLAAAEFARVDGEAADELRRLVTVNGDPAPVDVPEPRYPYRPHRTGGGG